MKKVKTAKAINKTITTKFIKYGWFLNHKIGINQLSLSLFFFSILTSIINRISTKAINLLKPKACSWKVIEATLTKRTSNPPMKTII